MNSGSALAGGRRVPFAIEAILRHYAARRRVDPDIDWRRAAALAGARTSPAGPKQALDDALAIAIAEVVRPRR